MAENVAVMLSRSIDVLPRTGGWAFEPKLDGFRCVLTTSEFGDVRLTSRRGEALGRYFPEIAAAGLLLPREVVLDGELVVPRAGGIDFAALQRRLHPSTARAAQLATREPSALIAFDVLAHEGRDLRVQSYEQRRRVLEGLLGSTALAGIGLMPMTLDVDAAATWLADQPTGVEGVVAKKLASRYRPGVRGWQKLRARRTAEALVGGVLGSLDRPEGLVLGVHEHGRLRVAGRTGPPSPALRAELRTALRPSTGPHPWPSRLPSSRFGQLPGEEIEYVQVAPELVVEIETDTAREHGRWRHATRLVRIRHDLTVDDVTAESA